MSAASFLKRIAAQKRRLGIGAGILVGLIALYGLLGYFWLPGYIRAKMENGLSASLHRPVTVRSIDIQPYTLEFTVHGFRVEEKLSDSDAGHDLLSFEELYVNVSGASLTKGAPVVSAVTLRGPSVRLVREGENRFNITDLIEDFMKQPPSEGKTMFSVSNIVVEDGSFILIDQLKDSRQEISGIRLGVPFVANLKSDEQSWVEPHFSANVNGAPLTLNGKLRPFSANREGTLELKLNDVDLTHVDEYSPVPVGIRLGSGYLDSNLVLTFTQTDSEPPKITLTGEAALRKLGIENRGTEIPYVAKIAEIQIKPVELNLNGAKQSHVTLALGGAAISREGEEQPLLSLPSLKVSQSSIDLTRQSVTLGDITLDRIHASLRRESDGRLNLAKLFTPASHSMAPREAIAPKAKAGKPWEVRFGSFKLTGAALRYEDVSLPNVSPMIVQPLDLTVADIDLRGAEPLKIALKAAVNEKGSLETNGRLAWAPLAVEFDVDAKDVDLVPLQGWAGDKMNALITSGATSFRGKIKADGSPIKVVLLGDGKFTNFSVVDKSATTDLMRWRALDIRGIEFVNEPLRANIEAVSIADFFAYVVITPKGDLNLTHIVRQEGNNESPAPPPLPAETAEPGPATAAKTVAKTTTPAGRKSTPVRISRISLQGGNINFQDQFIKPNYKANLTGLAGRIGPLDPQKPGEIDVHGAIDKTAPLKISGKVNTFAKEMYLDVTASAKGIDMPGFSPYSAKYIGYTIEKGKLSVDVHYHVEKGELTAENNVFLDQLTFGEKIKSPDALSIPVTLAVALLKNREGEINLHLPVTGSVNDPHFSIGSVLANAFVNLLSKAVTAPFALLGSVFGRSGEELSEISFEPGRADIGPEAEKSLQALSKALKDRPALKLEITGEADPVHDPEALKRVMLERKVKARKLLENVKKGETSGSLDDIALTPDEYAKYLTLAYKDEKFDKPKNVIGFTKSLPVPEMEQLMLANIDAAESEMHDLAQARAENARDWLVEKGGVPADRIFVLQPRVQAGDGKKPSSRVQFSLG